MMRKIFRFFMLLALVSIIAIPGFSDCAAQVAINEFLADPARDWDGDGALSSRDDEWVEIVNLGKTAVDLAGYRLADGEGRPVWRYGFSGVLEAGAIRVVYGSDARAWEEANGFAVYGLSLNNTGDRIALYRIAGTDTALVDGYTYAEVAVRDDRAIGRRIDMPAVWVVFDANNPCTSTCVPPGSGCYPTPGSANTCTTATESRSWGSIKSIYR
ncbi:MAG: lamin tail domain-containing protein [Candidatus Krumholzibacteria bacterium]|nr:lamin tail domain-containing protein [Candidatus Krumholzibacteria bacterium]